MFDIYVMAATMQFVAVFLVFNFLLNSGVISWIRRGGKKRLARKA
jgi:hypothetical protein